MYKQLSDGYLAAAVAYSKVAEIEQVAINNKQVAEECKSKLNVLLSANVAQYKTIKTILLEKYDSININSYEIESEYYKDLEYHDSLITVCDDLINLRVSLET